MGQKVIEGTIYREYYDNFPKFFKKYIKGPKGEVTELGAFFADVGGEYYARPSIRPFKEKASGDEIYIPSLVRGKDGKLYIAGHDKKFTPADIQTCIEQGFQEKFARLTSPPPPGLAEIPKKLSEKGIILSQCGKFLINTKKRTINDGSFSFLQPFVNDDGSFKDMVIPDDVVVENISILEDLK